MAAPIDSKDLAYKLWCENGQNVSATEKELKKREYSISRVTLTEWRDKYDWQGRAARAEAEIKRQESATTEHALLEKLLIQKQKYEEYFESLEIRKVDNQAMYAYTGILKTILEIKQKADKSASQAIKNIEKKAGKSIPEETLRIIKEEIYGIV